MSSREAASTTAPAGGVHPAMRELAPQGGRPWSERVKNCQVGYLPHETKFAMVTAAAGRDVMVRRAADDQVVLRATAGEGAEDADTGDVVRAVDVSGVTEEGGYYLDVPGVGMGCEFEVGAGVFRRAARLAMRMFTGQRCGTAVSLGPEFPEFAHEACHLGEAGFHLSSGREGKRVCRGGWHDAGDYGRYTVNACVTTGTLLWAYELNECRLRPLELDVPESGGRLPDVLAEIKWNLDWLLCMQDESDGGVWHKVTSLEFPGFVMPEEDRLSQAIIGSGVAPYKTTQATADVAATLGTAARVYRRYDAGFADKCLRAAVRAWEWAVAHPVSCYEQNPEGVKTGAYPDRKADDELLWAAAELFRTTGERRYDEYFVAHQGAWTPAVAGEGPQWWQDVRNFAMYAYALADRGKADAKVADRIRDDAVLAADAIVNRIERNAYRVPMLSRDYNWGSNAVVANYGVMLLVTNRWHPRAAYVNGAQDVLHYLLGRNTFNMSFVTQVGHRWPMHPHHRPSGADKVKEPWPGMLVGGPNAGRGHERPARQWADDQESYTTNEVAINWNAPLVFLLAEALPA